MNPTGTEMPQFLRNLLAAPPRHGEGVHNFIFRVARVMHPYRSEDEIFQTLRATLSDCGRDVPDREILDAIRNSAQCAWQPGAQIGTRPPVRPKWPIPNREQVEAAVANCLEMVDLWEISPYRLIEGTPQTEDFIDMLFPGNPLLCCGKTPRKAGTRRREEWRRKLGNLSYIVPNTMTAETGTNQTGHESRRCLDNTGPRCFLVIEFDRQTQDRQAALLWHLQRKFLPLALAVLSGGKSLHGWFCVGGINEETLHKFMRTAVSLGADPATWVRCQMVRMPDGLRYGDENKPVRQRVIFFNPEALQ